MITYLDSSVFDSPAQTLVNTVNTVGVMGKGIAKGFKTRYPEMFKEYRALCDSSALTIGLLHIWRSDKRWVLNFPTKTTWRKPSELRYVELGLKKFVDSYSKLGISSASFPPLGCGNGNLDWQDVKPLMEGYLSKASIPIYIHNVQVAHSFVPEHHESYVAPAKFADFLQDLRCILSNTQRHFETTKSSMFKAILTPDGGLEVLLSTGRSEYISHEMIEESWLRLRDRILSIDSFSDERSKKLKSYLFPIVATLPYIRSVEIRKPDKPLNKAIALYLDRDATEGYHDTNIISEEQGCLFQ